LEGSYKFIYQEIQIYFLVIVDQTAWPCISPKVTVKGVKKCLISIAVVGTDGDSCGMAVKGMGMLGVSVRMMTTLIVKMETVTLIGKGRLNLAYFVCKYMQLTVKFFS
jgi:hypothetical protein